VRPVCNPGGKQSPALTNPLVDRAYTLAYGQRSRQRPRKGGGGSTGRVPAWMHHPLRASALVVSAHALRRTDQYQGCSSHQWSGWGSLVSTVGATHEMRTLPPAGESAHALPRSYMGAHRTRRRWYAPGLASCWGCADLANVPGAGRLAYSARRCTPQTRPAHTQHAGMHANGNAAHRLSAKHAFTPHPALRAACCAPPRSRHQQLYRASTRRDTQTSLSEITTRPAAPHAQRCAPGHGGLSTHRSHLFVP
jgi:hypothetical protein